MTLDQLVNVYVAILIERELEIENDIFSEQRYAAVQFPTVNRVFGNLVANDIVPVQPFSAPVAKLFYLDPPISL